MLGILTSYPPRLDSDLFFFNDTATTEIYTLSLHDALPIYHSLRSKMRWAAAATNSSWGFPNSAQTRSMASVTSSVAWRATYSLTASLNNWLRDFFVRRASRSAPSKTSSGMETAVFIPLV